MEFRIGVNLGDVIDDEGRIYGDGVNIAARIEGLAEGGGIYISGKAYEEVKNRLNLGFEDLGEHQVKNIAEPLQVYRILKGAQSSKPSTPGPVKKKRGRRAMAIGAMIVFFVLAAWAAAIWRTYIHIPSFETVSPERITLDVPGGPSIAILPFTNMTDSPENDYLADGLTENIITGLSGCPKLLIIAATRVSFIKERPSRSERWRENLVCAIWWKAVFRKVMTACEPPFN